MRATDLLQGRFGELDTPDVEQVPGIRDRVAGWPVDLDVDRRLNAVEDAQGGIIETRIAPDEKGARSVFGYFRDQAGKDVGKGVMPVVDALTIVRLASIAARRAGLT